MPILQNNIFEILSHFSAKQIFKKNTHKNNIRICTNICTAVTCTCVLDFSWNKFQPTKFKFLVDNLILFSLAFRYRLFFKCINP